MADKDKIRAAINEGDYKKAAGLLREYISEPDRYDDEIAIFHAAIGEHSGNRESMWEAIRRGLFINFKNYELYVMLGNYYLCENMQKSWLCYENALFYCDNPEDREEIEGLMGQLETEYGVFVNKAAIVILSYNQLKYTKGCVESIRQTIPESAREIIVVDNASEDESVKWLREQADVILIENEKNLGFPAGCNQGILAASGESDIFLLNNDTILPENALFWLRMGLYDREDNGAVGSVSNVASEQTVIDGSHTVEELLDFGRRTNIPAKYPYEARVSLVGFALLIRRRALEQVGLLDERFSPGNCEDIDYGVRILNAGYRNVLCKNSFILHFGGGSFGRNESYWTLLREKQRMLNEKWGFRVLPRETDRLMEHAQEPAEKPLRILHIGCGAGDTLGYSGGLYPNAKLYGIEKDPKAAQMASHMGIVVCGDVEKMEFPWEKGFFDYVLMGHVLEQCRNPEAALKKIRGYLKEGGYLIANVFNVVHYSVMIPLLLQDRFSYEGWGILSRENLKFYTGTEIVGIIRESGYKEMEMFSRQTLPEALEEREKEVINRLTELMGEDCREPLQTYEYIVKAAK